MPLLTPPVVRDCYKECDCCGMPFLEFDREDAYRDFFLCGSCLLEVEAGDDSLRHVSPWEMLDRADASVRQDPSK